MPRALARGVACVLLATVLGARARPACADVPVAWPSGPGPGAALETDPMQAVRWSAMGAWISGQPASVQPALDALDARLGDDPHAAALRADRAVILRAMGRFDDAQRELDRALAQDRAL
jgi:hypothetical protein